MKDALKVMSEHIVISLQMLRSNAKSNVAKSVQSIRYIETLVIGLRTFDFRPRPSSSPTSLPVAGSERPAGIPGIG